MIKVKLDEGAFLPKQAHSEDAGYDLFIPDTPKYKFLVLKPRSSIVIDTGVHMEIPSGYCGVMISKSGLNTKDDITSTGLVDEGFIGSIKVKLYNHGDKYKCFKAGQKISQIAIIPCRHDELQVVDKLDETDRGENGFGSTGQ